MLKKSKLYIYKHYIIRFTFGLDELEKGQSIVTLLPIIGELFRSSMVSVGEVS